MSLMRSTTFGKVLCAAMGLDPGAVSKITVVSDPRDIVRVTVEMNLQGMTPEQLNTVVSALKADDVEIAIDRQTPRRIVVKATHKDTDSDESDELEGVDDGKQSL